MTPTVTPDVTPQTKVNEITFIPNLVISGTENEEPVVADTAELRSPTVGTQTSFQPTGFPNVSVAVHPFDKNGSKCPLTMTGQYSDESETETRLEPPVVPQADEITP